MKNGGIPLSGRYKRMQYRVSHESKIIFIGANPSPGTYARKIPFSSNKSFWYHLADAGLINEDRDTLKQDELLRKIYLTKFTQQYHLGILNLAERPTKRFSEIKKNEIEPGRKRILAAIKKYRPHVVCFIGKRTYELFKEIKDCTYGWQPSIDSTRIFVMHTPLHGLAKVRVEELKKIGKAAGLL